ncbi:MBL fold metallo-hydrolase [Lactobacillus terrae]|uniref:MBL fold metallo-hydrolase n=1 Tax=Lactobacillus terrae TaxID=2269374 RepID=UPI000C1B6E84|nr:MBL fold metallo-hydrolase [Lactobacillus terrae]
MLITVLGMYGGYPYKGVGTTSYLLQKDGFKLLIDCGSGSLNELSRYIDPTELDAVVLSHYHHDHTADLGVLQYNLLASDREEPLPIYGHTRDFVNFAQLTLDGATKGIAYNDYEELKIGPFKFNFMETIHPVPAYAMRIQANGKSIVFTADTAYFDGLIDFSKGADLLITDTNFPEEKTGKIWHMTTKETGELAKKAKVERVMISHLPQTIDHSIMLKQTQKYAEDIPVIRAFQDLELDV